MDNLADWRDTLEKIGVYEYFEGFFDWFPYEGELEPLSTLTTEELAATRTVHALMAEAISGPEKTNSEFEASGWPQRIAPAATEALKIFSVRGWFSEDQEETEPSAPLPTWIGVHSAGGR